MRCLRGHAGYEIAAQYFRTIIVIAIQPDGGIDSVDDLGDVLISGGSTSQIYLRDVAHVRRGYVEPQDKMIRFDGNPAIGLGISTAAG
ncbi:MAG TPA: efflux RND transporter permease subunit, partial [Sneathiellales bacterium]|nr:efflux RND transporter permease subunit [Sneathiellales bacterium]